MVSRADSTAAKFTRMKQSTIVNGQDAEDEQSGRHFQLHEAKTRWDFDGDFWIAVQRAKAHGIDVNNVPRFPIK